MNKPKGSYADYISGDPSKYTNKIFVFELTKRNLSGNTSTGKPTGVRSKETGMPIPFPLSRPFPMTGRVFFKDDKGKVYPRLIRFAEGEKSIYVDEQTPDDKNPKRKVIANFVKGRFQVDGQEETMLKFFMTWDINESKIGRDTKKTAYFRLVDNSKIAQKARELEDEEFNVIKWCREADWDTKVQPLASMIFSAEIMLQDAGDIRHNLVQVAKRDVQSFKKFLDDPKTERTIVVKAAIEKGLIVVDSSLNSLFWADNSSVPLNTAAPGKEPIEDFVSKSFSGKGEEIYKGIVELLNPSEDYIAETKQDARIIEAPILKGATESDEELLTLINAGIEKGVVTVNANKIWWKYKNDNSKGEAGMIAKLRDNPIMLKLLKSDVSIE